MRGVVIVSGRRVRGWRGRDPGVLLGSPRDDAGNLIMLGTGQQHWATVHVADLADFFRRVLESRAARGFYVISDGSSPTVAELTEAAAFAVGAPGAVPGSDDEARGRLGDYFAEVLLLDQGAIAPRPEPSSAGSRPIPRLSTSSAAGRTARAPPSHDVDVTEEAADRRAIRELIDAYAHCADRRDADAQKALFTTDSALPGPHGGEGTIRPMTFAAGSR